LPLTVEFLGVCVQEVIKSTIKKDIRMFMVCF
jgi:hypothetical protein